MSSVHAPSTSVFDVARVREAFPILHEVVHGKPLVYLDSAATSQKPQQVIDALVRFYSEHNANIHRGIHALAEEATVQYERTRQHVARFIGARSARTIIFTRNATESVNLVAHAWGRRNVREGDEILVTQMEHHSNLVPWQMLAKEKGARLRHIPVTPEGRLDLSDLGTLLTERTRLVAVTAMSNALGTINPVKEIVQEAHKRGALVLVDGAQSVPHGPTSVAELDCDFLVFSAHKMLGPTGVGVLYARKEILEKMDPFLGGGEMILEVWDDHATYNEIPNRFEAGTPNVADVVAFDAALGYLDGVGMANVREHERRLVAYALKRFQEQEDIQLYGPADPAIRAGVVSFNFKDIHPHDVGTILDQEGIAVRAGHHCTQPLMRRFGVSGTCRASFYIYTTEDEVDRLITGLAKVREIFGAGLTGTQRHGGDVSEALP
jgi:cysteine desulfurase/selenocysteine lyase